MVFNITGKERLSWTLYAKDGTAMCRSAEEFSSPEGARRNISQLKISARALKWARVNEV